MNYKQLLDEFAPRYINNDDDYKIHVEKLNELLDVLYHRDWTTDERDYVHMLGLFIEEYEDKFEDDFELKGFDLFKAELEHFYYNCTYRLKNWNK